MTMMAIKKKYKNKHIWDCNEVLLIVIYARRNDFNADEKENIYLTLDEFVKQCQKNNYFRTT